MKLPFFIISMFSYVKVENVVNPPQNPAPIKIDDVESISLLFTNCPITNPNIKHPITLDKEVVIGYLCMFKIGI